LNHDSHCLSSVNRRTRERFAFRARSWAAMCDDSAFIVISIKP
jgi:hypothetical protein